MKKKLHTSLSLSERLSNKLDLCVDKLGVDKCELLSVLCYKAGTCLYTEGRFFQTVDYQERGGDYEITPVCFYAADHEYIHANRLARKISVSKLLACAMELFLDEIMAKGIDQIELMKLRMIQKNSYKEKTYTSPNFVFNLTKNDQFDEYRMWLKITKLKT